MALITLMQLLSRTTLVDTNHGNSNGPGSFTDTKAKIAVVCIDIAAFLGCFDNFDNGFEDAFVNVACFEFAEEL
jgi:hypothetical protein